MLYTYRYIYYICITVAVLDEAYISSLTYSPLPLQQYLVVMIVGRRSTACLHCRRDNNIPILYL